MEIQLEKIAIRELTEQYKDDQEDGVFGYKGLLNIRPPFQREFVYNEKQRSAVINTIRKNYPLNTMYWSLTDENTYEIIDGQQRTVSICQYVNGDFSFEGMYFHNLEEDKKNKILDYELQIYICTGTDSEKLEWFEVINIAGEKLTFQELRNAVYHGSWVTEAKRYFSKTKCPAYQIGNKYIKGSSIRQDYLETTIKWISNNNIEDYMAKNQHKPNSNEIWLYFQSVMSWVKVTFPIYRNEMKGIEWGYLYNEYKDKELDYKKLENEISKLMQDVDVNNKKGIYLYVLNHKEKYLNIRAFDDRERRQTYEKQKGICVNCKEHFQIEEMEADHITPWHEGGKTITKNCQMLCKECNRRKSGK